MNSQKEVKEIREVNAAKELKELKRSTAAFFDLDGTLMTEPSMERRFFRLLRYQREIGVRNYWLWLREAVRMWPRGIQQMLQANKMYLRGVQSFEEPGERAPDFRLRHEGGDQTEGQAAALWRNPRLPVPDFFAEAAERVAWHAKEGHAIVLVSGTLEPLAEEAARSLDAELRVRGIAARICVCATRLEERDGQWTGKVQGDAMFRKAKARAARDIAAEMNLDLAQCFAYGDSAADAWLLALVGRPRAVNPSKKLAGIARTHGWPILNWGKKRNERKDARARREEETASRDCGMELVRPEIQE